VELPIRTSPSSQGPWPKTSPVSLLRPGWSSPFKRVTVLPREHFKVAEPPRRPTRRWRSCTARMGFNTRTFQVMVGEDGGTKGVDDDFIARGFDNIGAWIIGRNMFGPVHGPCPDETWTGWWGDDPPYHTPVFVFTTHARVRVCVSRTTCGTVLRVAPRITTTIVLLTALLAGIITPAMACALMCDRHPRVESQRHCDQPSDSMPGMVHRHSAMMQPDVGATSLMSVSQSCRSNCVTTERLNVSRKIYTTKMRTFAPSFSCSNCSVAEAPCKQYAQVGDSRTRTRMEDAESLNGPFRGARSLEEKLTRRGCPLGVELPP
jgi:hypothetical protein